MNLNVEARWQHGVLLLAAVGLISGCIIFMIGVTGSGTADAVPWWVGAIVIGASAVVGAWGLRSLLRALARANVLRQIDEGLFALDPSSPSGVIRLNVAIREHFGFPVRREKAGMPGTFGELAAAVARQVGMGSTIKPAQYEAARGALADVLGRRVETIPWSGKVSELFPRGKGRYQAWERLRKAAPALPAATLNPWVENIAIYGFLAALIAIAIAVPIAQHLDAKGTTAAEPGALDRVADRGMGLLVFGIAIAVLMVPVHFIGRRFACRIPALFDSVPSLAAVFRDDSDDADFWTPELVAAHLCDLACENLCLMPGMVGNETVLISGEGRRRDL